MRLSDLVKEANLSKVELIGDCEIASLSQDSRKKTDKGLFFCIAGAKIDSHDLAEQALENGAAALVVERWLKHISAPQLLVENSRKAMALLSSAFFGHPSRKMKMIGITGTKGKTTTSYLVKSIVDAAGIPSGLIGSTGNWIRDKREPGKLTTPDPIDLNETLHRMERAGVEVVCMEVSAHAIHMNRIEGIEFFAACYTNFSQDHLDYFGTMDSYFETKKSFFASGAVRNAVINVDDDRAEEISKVVTYPKVSYGISTNADVFARDIEIADKFLSFDICLCREKLQRINMKVMGMFNVYNALAASAIGLTLGISPDKICEGLSDIKVVPGRAEVLDTETAYMVVLDYSHAPAALENILTTIKEFVKGRLIVLFGCGGDRDRAKRPIMGKVAGEHADYAILTSDNPRSEDPAAILQSIEEGIKGTPCQYTVIEDRRAAILHALQFARENDIVVLAGKGDETYQEIKGVKYPFDERVVVAELLKEME